MKAAVLTIITANPIFINHLRRKEVKGKESQGLRVLQTSLGGVSSRGTGSPTPGEGTSLRGDSGPESESLTVTTGGVSSDLGSGVVTSQPPGNPREFLLLQICLVKGAEQHLAQTVRRARCSDPGTKKLERVQTGT